MSETARDKEAKDEDKHMGKETHFNVTGMTCAACSAAVERNVSRCGCRRCSREPADRDHAGQV